MVTTGNTASVSKMLDTTVRPTGLVDEFCPAANISECLAALASLATAKGEQATASRHHSVDLQAHGTKLHLVRLTPAIAATT